MIIRGLETAANGMQALIDQNDSTANNVANVNTVGFKKQSLIFQNIYNSNVIQKDSQTDENKSVGELSVGSRVQKLTYDFSQGTLDKTGNPFDLAIQGDGFFKIQSNDGDISYTRNGSFTMNNNGELVTKDGEYVLDVRNRKIKIKTNDVVMHSLNDIIINEDGQIELNNEGNRITMQKIGIFDFSNKEDMICIGGSQFKPIDPNTNKELKAEKFSVEQGSLEMSNANTVNEMIKTINTSRNYEALSKVVKSSGDTLTTAIKVGRI
ncbi:MAG: flagellar basal-body rod protein FlgF [Candidatus Gastranaerophilales bacterium]|nr:flagellar basal-body rod protein FlgF [Candidatus Gastranaerophilales bacterium]